MTTHFLPKLAVAVTALLALSIPSAFAAQAMSTVNVRTGPGTNFGVISHLYAGQTAQVQQRAGSWCYVIKTGPDGWVSCGYLTSYMASRYVGSPSVSLSFSFGTRDGDRDYRPHRPHRGNWHDHDGRDWDRSNSIGLSLIN